MLQSEMPLRRKFTQAGAQYFTTEMSSFVSGCVDTYPSSVKLASLPAQTASARTSTARTTAAMQTRTTLRT